MSTTWTKNSITFASATEIVAAAAAASSELGLAASIVVVDEAGIPVISARMDGASQFSVQVAGDKAYTAANAGMPTAVWDQVVDGNALVATRLTSAINRLNLMPGGIPLTVGGAVVGAIGVSGGTDDQDVSIASAGAAVLG